MLALLEIAFATLAASGCYQTMPLGEKDRDTGTDGDTDTDTGWVDVCLDWRPDGCRIPIPNADGTPPFETLGDPIEGTDPIHGGSWTFTALQSDVEGRLYAFFWWVAPSELDEPTPIVKHLGWRTRAPGEESWSEIRAIPGVTLEDRKQARCAEPSEIMPVQFASTDDGYVHAFWRKNNSCLGGGVYYFEHAIFEGGQAAYRHNLEVACPPGRDLRMTDALGRPDGDVQVALLCGTDAWVQRFSCGCWAEPRLVVSDREDQEVVLVEAGEEEPWLVVKDEFLDLQLRRPANAPIAISDAGNVAGTPVAIMDDGGVLWVAWQAGTTPSRTVQVSSLVDGAFGPAVALPSGTEGADIQAIDGAFVPGRGAALLTEETFSPPSAPGVKTNEVDDLFWFRAFSGGEWSAPVLAASNHATFEGSLARHTASDLDVAVGTPHLIYETYVGGETMFELRVAEVPAAEGPR